MIEDLITRRMRIKEIIKESQDVIEYNPIRNGVTMTFFQVSLIKQEPEVGSGGIVQEVNGPFFIIAVDDISFEFVGADSSTLVDNIKRGLVIVFPIIGEKTDHSLGFGRQRRIIFSLVLIKTDLGGGCFFEEEEVDIISQGFSGKAPDIAGHEADDRRPLDPGDSG